MDFSDRFLLSYDIGKMEEIRVISPMDERYRVPDKINEQAFALSMTAEQRKAYLERVKRMAREAGRTRGEQSEIGEAGSVGREQSKYGDREKPGGSAGNAGMNGKVLKGSANGERSGSTESGRGGTGEIVGFGVKDVIVESSIKDVAAESGIRAGTADSGLAEMLEPKTPMEVLGHLGKTGEEIAEKQVVIGSWMPEYEYDIVTEFPFGESGKDELPF